MGGRRRTVAEKLKLVKMADEFGVTRACKATGFSRGHCYRLRDLFKRQGRAGLRPQSRRKPLREPRLLIPEDHVLDVTHQKAEWSKERVAEELRNISPTGVYGVWRRHKPKLTTAGERDVFAATPRRVKYLLRAPEGPSPSPAPVRIIDAKGNLLRVEYPGGQEQRASLTSPRRASTSRARHNGRDRRLP